MSNLANFLKRKFSEYYRENHEHIPPPTSMEMREFGFIFHEEGMMIRHKGFKSEEAFTKNLSLGPSDIYYSSAYYEKPEEPMDKKQWLGADLIFDIDSDHLETPCKNKHEYWLCRNCENPITVQSEKCLICGGISFKKEIWLCETCLETAKVETLKLCDFLIDDFSFLPRDIEICFSGQRGYHASVQELRIRQLDQAARKEIVDYISGTGLNIRFHGLMEIKNGRIRGLEGPDLNDPGWDGRIARGVYGLLSSTTPQQLKVLPGINKSAIQVLLDNREGILEGWSKTIPWGIKSLNITIWEEIIHKILKNQAAIIDTVVTTDVHRLIRLPQSLHGKTGLKATRISINELERFDPLKDAIAFRQGTQKIHISKAYSFRIGDIEFGPYEDKDIELPLAAAVYLLCKRVAVPII